MNFAEICINFTWKINQCLGGKNTTPSHGLNLLVMTTPIKLLHLKICIHIYISLGSP